MEARLIEEDVVLLMIDLQKLARFLRALSRESFYIVLWLLGGLQVDTRSRCHGP